LEQLGHLFFLLAVVDHHIGEPRLPPALAVVNPNRLDETSPHRQLAAVGVTYLLVIAVNRHLRKAGFYATRNEPDLLQWLDLVALGTVCDVASLTGVNRAFVVQGLQFAAKRGNPGIAALADVAKVEMRPTAYHLGFALGPRVNAGGRVGEASLGARLLATEDVVEARELAAHLDVLNMERRQIEADVQEQAIAQIEAAGEIGELSGNTVTLAEQAGEKLAQLVPDIQKTAELVQEISVASREQDAGSDEINRGLQQLDAVVQQSATSAEQLANSALELSAQVEQQRAAISFFKLEESEMQQLEINQERRNQFSPGVPLRIATATEQQHAANNNAGFELDMDDNDQFVKY